MSKIILITGSSRGIGREAALLAADRGYTVAVNYQSNKAKADEVVAAIEKKGGKAAAFQADVAKQADVARLFAEVDKKLGRIDALVNNAGVGYTQGRLDTTKPEHMVATFEVNVFGLFYCCQEAVRRMSTRHGGKGGVIVNISSGAARNGGPGAYIDYAGSIAKPMQRPEALLPMRPASTSRTEASGFSSAKRRAACSPIQPAPITKQSQVTSPFCGSRASSGPEVAYQPETVGSACGGSTTICFACFMTVLVHR